MGRVIFPTGKRRTNFVNNFHRWIVFFIAAIALASMWFYVDRILVGYQVADAAAHDRPRGNLSDLYPRWLGARELLHHHRNPYSEEVTREIQQGYYGRVLDPSRANDPKDQQGFAYPVYVSFLLAPVIGFSFHRVQIFFHWFLIAISVLSVLLWLRSLRWKLPAVLSTAASLLVLGSVPVVQGIKLQQLTLLVAALVAVAAACAVDGLLFIVGVLMGLATIKPQLTWPLVAWLLLWSIADWKQRRNLVFGFAATMVSLFAASEFVLPSWWRMFFDAIRHYHQYTQNLSVLDQLVNWFLGSYGGTVLAACACAPVGWILWKARHHALEEMGAYFALILALTVLIVPMYAPYNQVLLVPAALLCIRDRKVAATGPLRILLGATGFAMAWQWIAAIALTVTWFLAPATAMNGWRLPFYATFALPVLVFVLSLAVASASPRFLQVHNAAE